MKIEGIVVEINETGDLITDITAEKLKGAPADESVRIHFDGHETVGIHTLEHSEPEMTLLALIGKSGKLEITITGISVSDMLGIRVGEKVTVKW